MIKRPTNDLERIRQVDLNLLCVFDAIARERSMAVAAQRLGLSQPGLSRALARLRSEFDDKLFVRSRDGLTLTPRAEYAHTKVREALRLVERALAEDRTFEPAVASRRFTVVMPDHCEATLLCRVMKTLTREAPGVTLRCLPSGSAEASPDGDGDGAELLIDVRPPDMPGLLTRKLLQQPLLCVVRRGHPALQGGQIGLEDFIGLRHVQISQDAYGAQLIDGALAARQLSRAAAVEVHGVTALAELLGGSDMIATLPEQVALGLARGGELVAVRPPIDFGTLDLGLIWHERWHGDPGHAWLRQLFIDAAAESFRERRPALAMVS